MTHAKEFFVNAAQKQFIISVQIDPPAKKENQEFETMLRRLAESGIRLIDVNSSRRISHDSIQLAVALALRGFSVIPHITTRDSSINGIANQVLAAYAWGGVNHFLVITGDPHELSRAIVPSQGVFQTDAVGALFALDQRLRKDTTFGLEIVLGAAVNPNELDLEREGERIKAKVAVGADFFMSQPVFSVSQASALFDFYEQYSKKPLLVGIWPIMHQRTLDALYHNRIVGVTLPQEIFERANILRSDEQRLQAWGLGRAYELAQFIKKSGRAAGVYIVAPGRDPLLLLPLLGELKS